MLEIALSREEPWPEQDWEALATRAALAAVERIARPQGSAQWAAWTTELQDTVKLAAEKDSELLTAEADPVHPARIYGELVPRLADDAVVIGGNGQNYPADFDGIAGYTSFDHGVIHVAQGETVTGSVTFQLPNAVAVSTVQWTALSGFGSTVEWIVHG